MQLYSTQAGLCILPGSTIELVNHFAAILLAVHMTKMHLVLHVTVGGLWSSQIRAIVWRLVGHVATVTSYNGKI